MLWLTLYRSFNDGKPAALVRVKGSAQYWITTIPFAEALGNDTYAIIATTTSMFSCGISDPDDDPTFL